MEARTRLKLSCGVLMAALTMTACSPGASPQGEARSDDGTPLVIEEVIIAAKGKEPDASRAALRPGQPLVLGIRTSRSAKNSTVEAKVFALATGQVMEKRTERSDKDAETMKLDLDDAKSWSAGRYLVEIRLDGKLAAQQEFDLTEMPQEASRP
ncbi:hypothetical protein [Pseudoxanthomonas sp. z9]|uniref:hypothetical protein n=1 Tax=Pseudoxanthomonas sp. z9 TaxID=2584942 RepID=UPI0011411B10|nr:hypothetical protein [Pseudoxanthomonas sp. z9]